MGVTVKLRVATAIMIVEDRGLCDGGLIEAQGWKSIPKDMAEIGGSEIDLRPRNPFSPPTAVTPDFGGFTGYSSFFRIYERPLLTSEAIRMWRAEIAAKCAESVPPTG